jgi:hypothetical protein
MVGLSFILEAGDLLDYYWIRKLFFAAVETTTFLAANGEFNEELIL